MQPSDIADLLKTFGFSDLVLTKMEGSVFTFKFQDFNLKKLNSMFGAPSIAGDGKVAVFVVPEYGKLGVSPTNRMVRLSYTGTHEKRTLNDNHLGKHETTEDLSFGFHRAKANPKFRTPFLSSLWDYFNETKFAGRLPKPKLIVSDKPPLKSVGPRTRGFFLADQYKLFGPGTIWIKDSLFNSTEAFLNEIVLHEMCHQAVSCVDKTRELLEAGHGPLWQAWMKKVGLDPRRFDPTEDTVYMDKATNAITEEKLTMFYGKATDPKEFAALEPVKGPTSGTVAVDIHGRMFIGKFQKIPRGYSFSGKAPNKKDFGFVFKTFPSAKVYKL